MQKILVTGGAGFIGSNFVLDWREASNQAVVNVDALTYAGNLQNLSSLEGDSHHIFVQADIADSACMAALLAEHQPSAVIHFAAESHVDRSIHGPEAFIQTNIVGTFRLLEAVRSYWSALAADQKQAFRYLHVSPTKSMALLRPAPPHSLKRTPTNPTARTAPAKPPAIISCAPTTTPTACPH